jgi:prolipoprotein diacylglyceryltransferase
VHLSHLLFDLLAYASAFLWKHYHPSPHIIEDETKRYGYFVTLIFGAIFGAFGFGTINAYISLHEVNIGKSVFGALFGGIVAAEFYKKRANIKGSTGASFAIPLTIGIVIGRVGCFFGGLEDFTYGTQTNFFLGYDFGDGVMRHPVQLYESGAMALFFLYAFRVLQKEPEFFREKIFYHFILFYSVQRFVWEFLKPYESIIFGLNIFQLGALLLMVYALRRLKK